MEDNDNIWLTLDFGWIFSSIFSQGLGMFPEEQHFEMFSPGCGKVIVDDKRSHLLFQAA